MGVRTVEWQKITDVEVGYKRYADGEWRVVQDELETKMEVRSNGMERSFTVTSATVSDGYPTLAELCIKDMNSVNPE